METENYPSLMLFVWEELIYMKIDFNTISTSNSIKCISWSDTNITMHALDRKYFYNISVTFENAHMLHKCFSLYNQ